MALLKVKHCHLGSLQLFCLLLELKVFRSIAFKFLYDLDIEYSDAVMFKSLYFGVGAASRHYDLIQLSQMVQSTYFITYEFFYPLQGSEKKVIFFKGLPMKH